MFPLTPWAGPRSSFVQPVEPPDVDPDTGGLISISFNLAWLPYVLGALTQLTQLSTWSGDDATKTLAVDRATLLLNLVGYPLATVPGPEPTGPPPITRYDPDTDTVQTSFDGGVTWIDNPAGDPRTASPLPPQTGDNADCNSAASARKYLVRFTSVLQTVGGVGVTATGLGYSIIGVLIELSGPWAIIADVAIAASLGFIAAGLSAINEALSDENLDTLECIIFCHTQGGKLTPAAFGQVESDVSDQIGGTNATIINAVLSLMGVGGLNSSMALKLDTDDCSGCGCGWCYTFDFTAGNGDWTAISGQGHYTAGGWNSSLVEFDSPSSAYQTLVMVKSFGVSTTLTGVQVEFERSTGDCNASGDYSTAIFANSFGDLLHGELVCTFSGSPWTWSGSQSAVDVTIILLAGRHDGHGDPGGNSLCTSITLQGTGTNPFGDSNC